MKIRTHVLLARAAWVCAAATVITSVSAVEVEAQRGRRAPSVQGELLGTVRVDADAMRFRLAIDIPAGHHGYVDKGDDGFFIPFAFTFPDLEEAGGEATVVDRPRGVRDEKVKAFVLRGRGEFDFEVRPLAAVAGEDELDVSLRYQICNDRTEVCYPPKRLALKIPLSRPVPSSDGGL